MTKAVFESKQRSVVRSSMLRDLVAIAPAVVYNARLPKYLVQELNVGPVLVLTHTLRQTVEHCAAQCGKLFGHGGSPYWYW